MYGFTLIELLITVAIMTILATIAVPSYQEFQRDSRRSDAHTAITDVSLAQQKLRGNCTFYAGSIGASNNCGANAGATTVSGSNTSPDGYYAISVTAASGNSFTIQADPQGSQASDLDCDPITLTVNAINPNGVKGPSLDCWN